MTISSKDDAIAVIKDHIRSATCRNGSCLTCISLKKKWNVGDEDIKFT